MNRRKSSWPGINKIPMLGYVPYSYPGQDSSALFIPCSGYVPFLVPWPGCTAHTLLRVCTISCTLARVHCSYPAQGTLIRVWVWHIPWPGAWSAKPVLCQVPRAGNDQCMAHILVIHWRRLAGVCHRFCSVYPNTHIIFFARYLLRWLGTVLGRTKCANFLPNLLFMTQSIRKWNNIRGSPCSIFQKMGPNIAIFDLLN